MSLTVKHVVPLLNGGSADGLGEMALAGARWAEEKSVLVLLDEVTGGELEDETAIHLPVEVEVEVEGVEEAERALEEACIARFGTRIRSDNGLVFQSRRFRAACREYRLTQEYITPYTPEQNGLIERFFRTLKEECTWQYNFRSFMESSCGHLSLDLLVQLDSGEHYKHYIWGFG